MHDFTAKVELKAERRTSSERLPGNHTPVGAVSHPRYGKLLIGVSQEQRPRLMLLRSNGQSVVCSLDGLIERCADELCKVLI